MGLRWVEIAGYLMVAWKDIYEAVLRDCRVAVMWGEFSAVQKEIWKDAWTAGLY